VGGGAPGDCVAFLQWALPRLGLRWAGFRRVRGQVCKRVRRRAHALGLPGLDAYRAHQAAPPDEWAVLERLARVTISRFCRDRAVFAALGETVLPALAEAAQAEGRGAVRAWSAGCASGEEPYTLVLVWRFGVAPRAPRAPRASGPGLEIVGTDVDRALLERARAAQYEASSLREVPEAWRREAFSEVDGRFVLAAEHRRAVRFALRDVRAPPPSGRFDLVLCRNLAFTYLDAPGQRAVLSHLAAALRPGGALAVGLHEALPEPAEAFAPWPRARAVFRRNR
jgi:chemotaxis protein methyltransferase CheR